MRILKMILLLLALAPGPVLAATCASKDEAVALKVAALRQQLISAALSCHEGAAYHAMVVRHQGELAVSDAVLKTFFAPRGGAAGYAAFQKKAAALSQQLQARNETAFCADMRMLFAALKTQGPGTLVAARGTSDAGGICRQFPLVPVPVRAPSPVSPPRLAVPIHLVKAVAIKPHGAGSIRADLPRIATAEPPQQIDDDPLPPRPPRSWMRQRAYAQSQPYGGGWYERSYGPPPGWYPPPPSRWYSREDDDE